MNKFDCQVRDLSGSMKEIDACAHLWGEVDDAGPRISRRNRVEVNRKLVVSPKQSTPKLYPRDHHLIRLMHKIPSHQEGCNRRSEPIDSGDCEWKRISLRRASDQDAYLLIRIMCLPEWN